jgi:hypothetical protein
MCDQSKPRLVEQLLIFFRIKARMIERFSLIVAQDFPLLWTGIQGKPQIPGKSPSQPQEADQWSGKRQYV